MRWPRALAEDETLELIIAGASIARFGDGELNLALGSDCITQPYNSEISQALRQILDDPIDCLVGIPRLGGGPKEQFWRKYYRSDVCKLFGQSQYVSAFITRPDSAPWIDREDYWNKIRNIWRDKDVTLVRGSEKSLTAEMLDDAKSVKEIIAPRRDAFASYKDLMAQVGTPETALLCLGPTATIMAHDLCGRGVHAIDLGHIGMFLRKHMRGLSMAVTEHDKAVDRV
jgi:hypothetical protein